MPRAAASPGTPRRVGVRDVARVAGVSTQTVSRVLNGHENIRDETRERVLAAMAELGYRVNNAARSLGTRSSRTLGVVASDAALYGPSVGIAALEAAARSVGRWIVTAYADATDEASLDSAVQHLLTQGVDGIILVAPHTRTLQSLAISDPGIPVAALHSAAGSERQAEASARVVEHLLRLGHTRIAELAGPAEWLEATARSRGVRDALAARSLAPTARWEGDWSAATGSAVADRVAAELARPDAPTAVVVANDQMALGLIAGLRARGLDVPGDVSVTGFDDNPDAAFYRPALTTVRLDIAGEARRCVTDVLGGGVPSLPASPRLLVRDSTGAPPR